MITGVSALVGGWINLLTAPWQPEDDWQDYKASLGSAGVRPSVSVYLVGLEDGAKAGLVYRW